MTAKEQDFIVVGKIGSPFGIKGWVKVFSYTDPEDNILRYKPWFIQQEGQWNSVSVNEGRIHGKVLVAHIESVDDRNSAEFLKGCDIAIRREQLPPAPSGEYYWIDLIGLRVINQQGIDLGVVDHMLETGANDVLVIKGDKERLIPFVMNEFIKSVDLDKQTIHVDWDVDF
jgi:16S rRNA processing protein RimM